MSTAMLGPIRRLNGVAGQIGYTVTVTYEHEAPMEITFVGSVYGGPVVMITERGQTFVSDSEQYGKFGPEWVRRFFNRR